MLAKEDQWQSKNGTNLEYNTQPRSSVDGSGVLLSLGFALGALKPWQVYGFAMMVTAATMGLRLAFDGSAGRTATLVIFTMPIMLSVYLGGLRAGLLATGLSYLAADLLLVAPAPFLRRCIRRRALAAIFPSCGRHIHLRFE